MNRRTVRQLIRGDCSIANGKGCDLKFLIDRELGQRIHCSFAIAAVFYSALTLVARTFPLSSILALLTAVGAPYSTLISLASLVFALVSRRVVLAVGAACVMTTVLVVQLPWYCLGRPAEVGQHIDVRVLSSNLRKGNANLDSIVGLGRDSADVLDVSELTPEAVTHFTRAGIGVAFPYSVVRPAPGAGGIGIWSRFPLTVVDTSARFASMAAARIQVPNVRFAPLVASVHVVNPTAFYFSAFTEWRTGITDIKARLSQFAKTAKSGAVIVAGDFNSTPDMRQFRDLLTGGYRDAVQQTASGFAPTFPNNNWVPPVITIDHVLTRNAAASSVHTVRIPGSDHRALLATIKVPLDPTAS